MQIMDIIHRYQELFAARYQHRITTRQRAAMHAVTDCRTARYGSMALDCTACEQHTMLHHACGNRACPRCQNHDTTLWLQRQQQKLLPVNYFMVTFTLPSELRALAWHHQKLMYGLLMLAARETLQQFAGNSKQLGDDIGMTMVLHTHTRRLDYHPHVHVIVPGIGVDRHRSQCTRLRGKYLFNGRALAASFRGKLLAQLNDTNLTIPAIPSKWIAHCKHVGKGLPALQYLSRYLYRGVISEKHILHDDGTHVTFGYVDSESQQYRTRTVRGETFLWLVFQHVLPKGFRRVRDYGFLHGNARKTLQRIQVTLKVWVTNETIRPRPAYTCRSCGGAMQITAFIAPTWRSG